MFMRDDEYINARLAESQAPKPIQAPKPSAVLDALKNRQPYQYQPLLNVMGGNFSGMNQGNNQPIPSLLSTGQLGQFGAGRFMNNGNNMVGTPLNAMIAGNNTGVNPFSSVTGLNMGGNPFASMQQSIASKAVK